jgi:Uncharacterized conserved protein
VNLCVTAGGKALVLAAELFTLSWEHSVEKVRWEETWRLTGAGLEIVEARVRGSGAGMEPPDGAVLRDGWWSYRPALPPQPALRLAASGKTSGGWTLCTDVTCTTLGAEAGEAITVAGCE